MTIQIRNLPDDLHKEARRQALEQGVSLNAWLIEIIRKALQTKV
jgi:predicted HicB family RNase H-like nuclease